MTQRELPDFGTNAQTNTRAKRIFNLLSHIPTFLLRFIRLIIFVIVLSPAFCVFLWHYLSCDRIAVYYGDCRCDTSNSDGTTDGKSNGTSCATRCKSCQPFFSRHYLDIYGSSSPTRNKPVILFLTGGAYIIGYKMWGTLLARALSQHVLVIVPDYRNYPRVTVEGMVNDIDKSVEWVLRNAEEFGGDRNRVVMVGQSAGAHLGGIVVIKKVLDRLRRVQGLNGDADEHTPLTTNYEANHLRGFISTSSPHNLVLMKQVFHRHGLSCSIQSSIFGSSDNNGRDINGEDIFEKWSTFHLVKKCQGEYTSLRKKGVPGDVAGLSLKDLFPNLCVIHGTNDKTVPVQESIEFLSLLSNLQIPCKQKLYEGWTHTDPILEAPMRGNHLYHKDVYDLVRLWSRDKISIANGHNRQPTGFANGVINGKFKTEHNGSVEDLPAILPDLDEQHPMLRPICPSILVEIARICNPF